MNYRIRKLDIKNKKDGLKEFGKIGAGTAGCHIMINKFFNIALKVKDVDIKAANILKQEMLSRGGDVVTSRRTLYGDKGKTDIIIFGTNKSIKSLIEKIKIQPFGLKSLSVELENFIYKFDKNKRGRVLRIGGREFDFEKEVATMGILNITPDSFYDGGNYYEKNKAFRRAEEIAGEGAHIIDVGGMSTRPGSKPVSLEEEIGRVIPVISHISKNCNIVISCDTYRSKVAELAIESGANIINDISGLTFDDYMAKVIAENNANVVIMHIKGSPEDMQKNPVYEDVVDEIYNYLYRKTLKAINSGIDEGKIIVDPGIGFGKTSEHNMIIINKLSEFKSLGFPILIGTSRKSFIGNILNLPAEERLEGSLSAAIYSVINGANILRVHDVKETLRALKVVKNIKDSF